MRRALSRSPGTVWAEEWVAGCPAQPGRTQAGPRHRAMEAADEAGIRLGIPHPGALGSALYLYEKAGAPLFSEWRELLVQGDFDGADRFAAETGLAAMREASTATSPIPPAPECSRTGEPDLIRRLVARTAHRRPSRRPADRVPGRAEAADPPGLRGLWVHRVLRTGGCRGGARISRGGTGLDRRGRRVVGPRDRGAEWPQCGCPAGPPRRVQRLLFDAGGSLGMAGAHRWFGRPRDPACHPRRGAHQPGAGTHDVLVHARSARARGGRVRQTRPDSGHLPATPAGRGILVSGVFRAGRGQRPGIHAHDCALPRRGLGDQRREVVDQLGSPRHPVRRTGPDRWPRVAGRQRLPGGHGHTGGDREPVGDDGWRRRVLLDIVRRRRGARGAPAR